MIIKSPSIKLKNSCVLQLQPLLKRIKEIGQSYSKTNTQVHPGSLILFLSFFLKNQDHLQIRTL